MSISPSQAPNLNAVFVELPEDLPIQFEHLEHGPTHRKKIVTLALSIVLLAGSVFLPGEAFDSSHFLLAESLGSWALVGSLALVLPRQVESCADLHRIIVAAGVMTSFALINNGLCKNEAHPRATIPLSVAGRVIGTILAIDLRRLPWA